MAKMFDKKSVGLGSAPLANFDCEEWNEFHDITLIESLNNPSICMSNEYGSAGPECSLKSSMNPVRIRTDSLPCGEETLDSIDDVLLESVSMFDEDPRPRSRTNSRQKPCPEKRNSVAQRRDMDDCCEDEEEMILAGLESDDVTLRRADKFKNDDLIVESASDNVLEEEILIEDKLTGSLEDLVNNFDDKVTKCIQDYDAQVEVIAPVQVRGTKETSIRESQSWWTLTGEFGNLMPINWSMRSYGRRRRGRRVAGRNNSAPSSDYDDDDDDDGDDDDSEEREEEELYIENRDLSDMDEEMMVPAPLDDADEIISELEAIMDEGTRSDQTVSSVDVSRGQTPDDDAMCRQNTNLQTANLLNNTNTTMSHRPDPTVWFKETLKRLTLEALSGLTNDLEQAVRKCQVACFEQLELNEQLRYSKQLHNEFINRMISIQNKLSTAAIDSNLNNARRPRRKLHHNNSTNTTDNRYLTTVVPYNSSSIPPSIEELQVYIKILAAIDEGSSSVPVLLTDYILKVLCPAQ